MKKVVLLDALRTPFGKYRGSLSALTSVDLGASVTRSLLEKNPSVTADVDQVIFGSVLQSGLGQNVARQISIKSGLDVTVPAFTVNEVCGSSLQALILGREKILSGDANVVIAGGSESMTNATTMQIDGLNDAFEEIPMGITVERLVDEFGLTREEIDAFALESQERAAAANFDTELAPLDELTSLETIRETSMEKLASLKPVFIENGIITAGNASPVNDGAAALLLASEDYAADKKLPVLANVLATVEVGVEPARMALSPIKAIRQLLEKTNLTVADIDRFEINEAFAASSLLINRELGISADKVNVKGGAIALGHPLGATGARLVTTLAHQLADERLHYGITSLCIGGGLGLAVLLENPNA